MRILDRGRDLDLGVHTGGVLGGSILPGRLPSQVAGQKHYGPGVSDTEIKIGNTMPYSGPASAIGAIGHTLTAYFKRLNEHGGVGGRREMMRAPGLRLQASGLAALAIVVCACGSSKPAAVKTANRELGTSKAGCSDATAAITSSGA